MITKNIITLLFLMMVYLSGQNLEATLEKAFKDKLKRDSKSLASFIEDQYNGDVLKLTKDSITFALENETARTIFNGFWRDLTINSNARSYLIEKLLIGRQEEIDISWQLLRLFDEDYTVSTGGHISAYPQIEENNKLPSKIPLEYKMYLYKQQPEQAIQIIKDEFSKSEQKMIKLFEENENSLWDTDKYNVWKNNISPVILKYLMTNPDKDFMEYLAFKIGVIYNSYDNSLANNKEIFNIFEGKLDNRVLSSLVQGHMSISQKTPIHEINSWIDLYKISLEQNRSSRQLEENTKPSQFTLRKKSLWQSKKKQILDYIEKLFYLTLIVFAVLFVMKKMRSKK